MFVACRLGEIQEDTDITQWHWVPSDLNVADQATKILKNANFDADSCWLVGPKFLQQSQEFWPEEPEPEHCNGMEEEYVCLVNVEVEKVLPDIERFSKYLRLIRSTAWVLQLIGVIRLPKKERPPRLFLDTKLMEEASTLWVRKSQSESFPVEISHLKQKKTIPKCSRLFQLSVFLDDSGIIRLGGRLSNETDICYDSRYPIILDPKHKYTQLLIDHHHERAGHVGIETIVNNLRLKYWILHVRAAVKRSFRGCQVCKIRLVKPVAPLMGNLPVQRIESTVFPFTYVGVDYFGPI